MLRIGVLAAVIIILAVIFVLYSLGHVPLKAKKSVVFMGNGIGRRQGAATFRVCEGYIKRVIRFEENRVYKFDFYPELKKGEVTVTLRNSRRETLLELTQEKKRGTVKVESGEKYVLTVDFRQSTGSYRLEWN